MNKIRDYRPIDFRQTCAIARVVLLANPLFSDAEWKAATRETAAKQGYDEPSSEMLARAMGAVEKVVKLTLGPRPSDPHAPAPAEKSERQPLTEREWSELAQTLRMVMARSQAAQPQNVSPIALNTLEISEEAAIDQFYAEANAGQRLAALKRFAEIAIVRPADWDVNAIRAGRPSVQLHAERCFACHARSRQLHWHHIVQIQHGGSNYARNLVAICDCCHGEIHPWLKVARKQVSGFSSFMDVSIPILQMIEGYLKNGRRRA